MLRSALALLLVVTIAAGCRPAAPPPPPAAPPVLVPPLSDAVTGEQLVTRRGDEEWQYTVVSAGNAESPSGDVVVEVVRYLSGAPQGRPVQFTWNRNGFGLQPGDVIRSLRPGRLDVGGRAWDCWIVMVQTAQRGEFAYWISPEVAVHGVLKIARAEGGDVEESGAITWARDSLSER